MPKELLAAFGMDTIDLSTVLGYFSFILMFAQLCLAIQAGNYGFGLVSIEESELTADFLMTKPVSRVRILTSKLLAVLANLIITNLVVWGAALRRSRFFVESVNMRCRPSCSCLRVDHFPALFRGGWTGCFTAGQESAECNSLLHGTWLWCIRTKCLQRCVWRCETRVDHAIQAS